jgi:DNA-binding GntR family transcriptional regulator
VFPELQSTLKRHQVTEVLRQAILRGDLQPGERIVESRIAREFGVSQTPVREALATLVREGLVVQFDHRGSFVAELDRDDLEEICTLRAVLEGYCARLAAGKGAVLDELDSHVDVMRAAAAGGDFGKLMEADVAFHRALHAVAGHTLLAEVLRSLQQRMRLTVAFADAYSEPDVVAESHATLLAAIRSGDGDLAERVARAHVLELLNLIEDRR